MRQYLMLKRKNQIKQPMRIQIRRKRKIFNDQIITGIIETSTIITKSKKCVKIVSAQIIPQVNNQVQNHNF